MFFTPEQVWMASLTKTDAGFDWLLAQSTEVIHTKWPLALLLAAEQRGTKTLERNVWGFNFTSNMVMDYWMVFNMILLLLWLIISYSTETIIIGNQIILEWAYMN